MPKKNFERKKKSVQSLKQWTVPLTQFYSGHQFVLHIHLHPNIGGCRGRDRMGVGFTTAYAISDYHR